MSDKMILSSEHEEQAAVVEYCRWRRIPVYHPPNEGKRSYWQAAHLAAAGMESGVPDLCIPVPKGGKGALYIEMKHGRGKLTSKQKEWLRVLQACGNAAKICYSAEEAIQTIERYLALPKEEK